MARHVELAWLGFPRISDRARKRHNRRRRVSSPAQQRLAFESLEYRRLLAVTSNFLTGTLMISLSANDDIALSTAGGNVKLAFDGMTGLDPDSGAFLPATCRAS